jgi:hypothetical protein
MFNFTTSPIHTLASVDLLGILGVDCRRHLPYENTKTSIQFRDGHSPYLYLYTQWISYNSHFHHSIGISGK